MFDFLDFIGSFFSSALGSLLSSIFTALTFLLYLIVAVFQALYAGLVVVFQFLYGILGKVGALFQKIWEGFFKRIFIKLLNAIITAHRWLEEKLAPVLRVLQRIRAFIDRIFARYIRPVLVLLQRIRQVLAVLRLLHIKWAEELDAKLAEIQGKIAQVFLTIRGALNSVIDVVNALSDPPRLVRLIAISVAGRRAAAALVRIFTGLPIGFFFPNYRSDAPPWEQPVRSSKDLLDPARNPLAGTLFDSLLPSPITPFVGLDPTPTTADLNQVDPFPYYLDELAAFLAVERTLEQPPGCTGDIHDAIERGLGCLADSAHEGAASVVLALEGA